MNCCKNIKKFLKKNYKKIIVVCLIMLLLSNKMYEKFSTTQALDAVKSTEAKVNNMAIKADANYLDLKSKIRLSNKWTGYPDKVKDQAEIANDRGSYKKLMIVGNKSGGGVRKVGVWDHLQVHGSQNVDSNLAVGGALTVNGINNKKKSWYWKEGTYQKAVNEKLHYLDRQWNHCKEGEFMSGIKWKRKGNDLSTVILCSKLN